MRYFHLIENGRLLGSMRIKTRAHTTTGITRAVRRSGRLYSLGISSWRQDIICLEATDGIVFTA